MSDCYVNWRKNQNIKPIEFPNKEKYYSDLLNIEHSWTGRMDGNICNTFIMEAEQQLVNAIELFEQGYFDGAYYSLRSAVDISTTMVFLDDMPDEECRKFLDAWKSTSDFPMQGQMIKQLAKYGNVFVDMKDKMPTFFASAKDLSAELNKYVHKQGLQHFYVSRNHPINQNKFQDQFLETFEKYLKKCIGVVAVMRLAIDPFPILLMDEEILYRCFDSMTEPYSNDFVEKYISMPIIEQYKLTDMYTETYDSFLCEEKKNEATFNVMKHQYIDTRRLDEIFSQLHLISDNDVYCVLLTASSDKVIKLYCYNGMLMYFTDRNTNRKALSWSGLDFKKFSENPERVNQVYDEAFISVFTFDKMDYFVEHNELLTPDDVGGIIGYVAGTMAKMKNETEDAETTGKMI